jgi:hypothetical protein
MVAVIIIPLIVTSTIGIIGYLTYKIVIFDYLCNRSVNTTLKKYDIKKTQFQIIKEYYENRGEPVTEKVIDQLAKQYRQKEPEQFLAMYDSLRDKTKSG